MDECMFSLYSEFVRIRLQVLHWADASQCARVYAYRSIDKQKSERSSENGEDNLKKKKESLN